MKIKNLILITTAIILTGCSINTKSPKLNNKSKIKQCPDQWIQNNMPGNTIKTDKEKQYYIIDGKRRDLNEFDSNWINENCDLKITTVE